MMDDQSKPVMEFIEALAQSHATLRGLARELRARPEAVDVTVTLSCSQYARNPHPFVEQYVEATLAHGKVIVWALELTWDEAAWSIDFDVAESGDDGRVLAAFPTRSPSSLAGMLSGLREASTELAASAASIDLSAPE